MSEQINRKEVNWKLAHCSGTDTEWFFMPLSELLTNGVSYQTLRSICFKCPIWKSCLQVAVQEEAHGFWGGLSEEERKHLYNDTRPRSHEQLMYELKNFGVSLETIRSVVKSVKRKFSYSSKLNV